MEKTYLLMLRILMKPELYLNQIVLSRNTNLKINNLKFKNNIYLGTISRAEPSLQAAFVNFEEKGSFLAFNDIQSDYYQIPSEDKENKTSRGKNS